MRIMLLDIGQQFSEISTVVEVEVVQFDQGGFGEKFQVLGSVENF